MAELRRRSRFRAFVLTLVTGQALAVLNTLIAFFTTPLLLEHLGAERFGLWRVLEVWVAYLSLIPQCVSQAAGFLLVGVLAEQDTCRLRRFVGTMIALGSGINFVFAVGGLALLPVLDWLIPAPDTLCGERQTAFLLAVLLPLPLSPFLLLRPLLEADQRGYLVNTVLVAHGLCYSVTAVALAIWGLGLAGQALAQVIAYGVQAGLFTWYCVRIHGWLATRPAWTEALVILRRASSLVLLAVLGGVAARLELPLVHRFAGAETAAQYVVGQRLFVVYAGLVATIGNSLWAPAASLFYSGERQQLAQYLSRMAVLTLWSGSAGSAVIYSGTEPFLRLWVGEGYDPGSLTRAGFAVTFPALGVNVLLTWLLSATGHMRAMYLTTVAYFVVTAVASISLGPLMGPAGIAWGTAAGAVAAMSISLVASSMIYGLPGIAVSSRLFITALLAVAYACLFTQLVKWVNPTGWFALIVLFGTGWLGYLLPTWFVVLPQADRSELWRRFRQR